MAMLANVKVRIVDGVLLVYAYLALHFLHDRLVLNVRESRFDQNTFIVALAVFVLALVMPRALRLLSLGCYICDAIDVKKRARNVSAKDGQTGSRVRVEGLGYILLTLVTGVVVTQMSLTDFLSESGFGGAKRIFSALVHPNVGILKETIVAAIETVYMALMATVVATPVAFVVSFFAARNLTRDSVVFSIVYLVVRFFLNCTRAVEALVWAIIFAVWVGFGPFAGMLALTLHSIASLAKLYSEQIEDVDNGPLEAMIATGASPLQVIWFGVVPQIVIPFLSFTIYRWDINVRMATVIGLVGGGGIGTMLYQYQGLGQWNEVGLIVMVIAAIVWMMDYASARIREAIQ